MTSLHDVDWSKLPAPEDDGAADHFVGMHMPALALPSTGGEPVDLSMIEGRCVVYAYPMTGRPDVPLPDNWDMLPGARGCTPQSCAFRDHASELAQAGAARLYGLSTQSTGYQREAAERLHLPFDLLSDDDLKFATALRLPTFETAGMTLLKRLTMILRDGAVEHVFYPVFPPDRNAEDVIAWLTDHPA